MRVDAHQHFWRLARGDYDWLAGDSAALAPLRRDFEPADLQALLTACRIERTVLVQAAATTAETDHLLALADEHDFIGGVVGWVDLADAGCVAQLERWAENPKFKGVRPMLQDLADPTWLLHGPRADALDALERLGLRLDALVRTEHLPTLLAFVRQRRGLPVVIDHAAKPALAEGWAGERAATWRAHMTELARQPQVCCKFSGLLTELSPAQLDDASAVAAALDPVWALLIEQFGADRLLWGSDWPVLLLADVYPGWWLHARNCVDRLPPDDRDAVLGGTAARFYALQ